MRGSKALISRLAAWPAMFVLIAMTAPSALATDHWVPKNYKTIQAAINASVDGDNILVMGGTYYENLDVLGKSLSFFEVLFGGHVTIDGGHLGACLRIDSGKAVVVVNGFEFINGAGQFDPFSGLSYGGGVCQTAGDLTLDSCTIRKCEAIQGGALYVGSGATATVTRGVFERCNRTAVSNLGGGIAVVDSFLTVKGATIQDCGTIGHTSSGGGIHAVRSSLSIREYSGETLITGNAAASGGGLWLEESFFNVDATLFGNVAARAGGGAAIYRCQLSPYGSTPRFEGSEFSYNAADRGSESEGGGLWIVDSLVDLSECDFHLNRSKRGGAFASLLGSASVIEQCSFRGNSARMGGGIFVSYSRFEASNTIIAENNCLFLPPLPKDGGGGICSVESTFDLDFCTVTRNQARVNASGIYYVGTPLGTTDLKTSIVWGNGGPGLARNLDDRSASPPMNLRLCDYEPGDDLHPGTNFQVDPLFDSASLVYDLLRRSPLVDVCAVGMSPYPNDFDGDPRPKDGDRDGVSAADCGAQERQRW